MEKEIIRRGQVFKTKNFGLVKFMGLDTYYGETTTVLRGIEHPGTYFPKIEVMMEQGFSFIDN